MYPLFIQITQLVNFKLISFSIAGGEQGRV